MSILADLINQHSRLSESKAEKAIVKERIRLEKHDCRESWLKVQRILRSVIPHDAGLKLSVMQINVYVEEVMPTHADVVAYVYLRRINYMWNLDVVPAAPLLPTPDEWRVIRDVETKILDLGLKLNYEVVDSGGNFSCWQLSLT